MPGPSSARREAESSRYRLQLMLTEVAFEADRQGETLVLEEVRALRARLLAIEIEGDDAAVGRSTESVLALRPEVEALAARVGLDLGPRDPAPKWRRLARWAGPGLLLLLLVLILFERRRKKAELTASSLAQLEAGENEDNHAEGRRKSTATQG